MNHPMTGWLVTRFKASPTALYRASVFRAAIRYSRFLTGDQKFLDRVVVKTIGVRVHTLGSCVTPRAALQQRHDATGIGPGSHLGHAHV